MPSLNTGNAILSNAIAVDSSYNVGIGGAASGSFKLQVTGTTSLTDNLTMTIASGTKSIGFGGNTIAAAANALIYSDTNYLVLNSKAGSPLYLNFDNANTSSTINMFNGKFILTQPGAATFSSSVTAASGLYNGYTSGLPPTSGSATRGGLRLNNASNIALDFGTVAAGQAWIQVSDAGNYASNFALLLNPNGGNVGIGTSSPGMPLQVSTTSTGTATYIEQNGTGNGLQVTSSGSSGTSFIFKARSTGVDRFLVYDNGQLLSDCNGSGLNGHMFLNSATTNPFGPWFRFNTDPNNGSNYYWVASAIVSGSEYVRAKMNSNGGLANYQSNNVNLSDERTKKDIIPLESYWDKFKAIEIVKFKYKDQTHDDFNIGVIAQQVEKVAPEFVDVDGWSKPKLDEDGNEIISEDEPLKSIYTADLHHATIKVLQECMSKIEEQQAQIEAQQQTINSLINR